MTENKYIHKRVFFLVLALIMMAFCIAFLLFVLLVVDDRRLIISTCLIFGLCTACILISLKNCCLKIVIGEKGIEIIRCFGKEYIPLQDIKSIFIVKQFIRNRYVGFTNFDLSIKRSNKGFKLEKRPVYQIFFNKCEFSVNDSNYILLENSYSAELNMGRNNAFNLEFDNQLLKTIFDLNISPLYLMLDTYENLNQVFRENNPKNVAVIGVSENNHVVRIDTK